MSDTSSTYSGDSIDSTTAQVNFKHREEPQVWEQRVGTPPQETPSSPRTAFAERLWMRWHETECLDLANCIHSFDAVYTDSPMNYPGQRPFRSSTSGSDYTLWGSKATNSSRTSTTRQAFEFDQGTDSAPPGGNHLVARRNRRPGAARLRRTWSDSGHRNVAPSIRSPPYTA
ncbi:hypothetical protein FSARC_8183 [Fusarium sarcochroum]|uniref:Uncharacterized protein n=1 Tax=Fusarium sarcochroum TaxID=1208366 RepID=A0A8H4TTE2_9HYPO|nr:hypothetical protein FSARC_8183 [Fusarium sarcochroum]